MALAGLAGGRAAVASATAEDCFVSPPVVPSASEKRTTEREPCTAMHVIGIVESRGHWRGRVAECCSVVALIPLP